MSRWFAAAIICITSIPALGQASQPATQPALRTVRVRAEGHNEADAQRRALRKAIEQGAGVELASFSAAENFQLIRDTIYSRAAGVVSDFRVLGEPRRSGGTVELEIEATVRLDVVARTWGELQHLLDQSGRPRIMVWIDERIDGELQPDSIVEARIEEMLAKSGFELIEKSAVEDLRRREGAAAHDEQNFARLAALAKDARAQILIRGFANANRAGLREVYGEKAAFYQCDVTAKVFYTDTARLITSESLPKVEAGARSHHEFSPQAARLALANATLREVDKPDEPAALAQRVYESVTAAWSLAATSAHEIEVEIDGLSFQAYLDVKKAIEAVAGVRSLTGEFTKGIASFRIRAEMRADVLAEKLAADPLRQFVEIVDLKLNRIQARSVAKP